MWSSCEEQLGDTSWLLVKIFLDGKRVTYAQVLQWWQEDACFREFFITLLADSQFSAFRWETPPITNATADREFEFVLIDRSNETARTLDPEPDAEQLCLAEDGVVAFEPEEDSILVMPFPVGQYSAYAHLGAFVREAPEPQRHALWKLVGKQMDGWLRRCGNKTVWLSAGTCVSWLRLQLVGHPNDYIHIPYRRAPEFFQGEYSNSPTIGRSKISDPAKFKKEQRREGGEPYTLQG